MESKKPGSQADTQAPVKSGIVEQIKRFGRRALSLDEQFDEFLDCMNEVEGQKKESLQKQLEHDYGYWAERFELLKYHFQEAWNLFGDIENDVEGWYRAAPNGGQWGYMAHCRQGYSFAAAIERNHRKGAPNASKWVSVTFACNTGCGAKGIGCETGLGREGKISDELVGLSGCSEPDLRKKAKAAERLVKTIDQYQLIFELNNKEIGQQQTRLNLEILNSHSLVELCERLFIALNNDELQKFGDSLPLPNALLIGNG